ncbi:MAG TPA: CARDB domain-containing protein [Solirubrobacteraceae bacterium]|nr:CARDB domain-containing protein [Solirubrobacteraceae bacterium]
MLVALSVATGSALAQDGAPVEPPALAATLEQCATSVLPAQRVAEFVGSMPASAPATRMRMRFDLERLRPRDARWQRLRGVPGFGDWEASAPSRAGFVFHKRLDGLPVPASYRAVVRFRWEDARGRVVRRARLRTPVCAQPDLRPNLVPGPLTGIFDTRPGLAIYTLVVRNTGRSAAGPFSVRVGGATTEVDGLGPGQSRTVLVVNALCLAGTSTLAEVDADDSVDESSERNNDARRRCPLWGA